MTGKEFETKLKRMYRGKVKTVTRYINSRCSMLFHCNKCGADFYGKPAHIIGKDHQKHICTMPYGDRFGNRVLRVNELTFNKTKFDTDISQLIERLDQLLNKGYKPSIVAKKVGLNAILVQVYAEECRTVKPLEVNGKTVYLFEVSKGGRESYKDGKGTLYLECTKCHTVKDSDSFSPYKQGFQGKQSSCRDCRNEVYKAKKGLQVN